MWSFVRCKAAKLWIWLAVCKQTRQVVACVIGVRGFETCDKRSNNIPDIYKQGIVFSDFWDGLPSCHP